MTDHQLDPICPGRPLQSERTALGFGARRRSKSVAGRVTFGCLLVALGMACLTASQTASAERYWRWVDSNGVVNYTQQKPYGIDAVQVSTLPGGSSPSTSSSSNSAASSGDEAEPSLDERQQSVLDALQQAELARQQEVARIEQDNCNRSRDVLNRLNVRSRIRVRNADGSARMMDETERQERIAEAQQGVAQYCK